MSVFKIPMQRTSNAETRKQLIEALKETGKQCPCVPSYLWGTDTKCPCKPAREHGDCICGLFERKEWQ